MKPVGISTGKFDNSLATVSTDMILSLSRFYKFVSLQSLNNT